MITANEALRQATVTAEHYAMYANSAYYKLFHDEGSDDPERSMDRRVAFVNAFMRTAAADFHTWVMHNTAEKAREAAADV